MDLAIAIAATVGALALLGALSAGSALGLYLWRPHWTRRRRTVSAASFASVLPMSLAFAGVLLEGGLWDVPKELGLALGALVLSTILLAAVNLPAAWLTSRGVERTERDAGLLDGSGNAPLLAGPDA